MRVGSAKPEDLMELADIKMEVFSGLPRFLIIDDMLSCINAGQCHKVTSDGKILGGAELARNDGGYELCSVFVARVWQGRGAGSALAKAIAQMPEQVTVNFEQSRHRRQCLRLCALCPSCSLPWVISDY